RRRGVEVRVEQRRVVVPFAEAVGQGRRVAVAVPGRGRGRGRVERVVPPRAGGERRVRGVGRRGQRRLVDRDLPREGEPVGVGRRPAIPVDRHVLRRGRAGQRLRGGREPPGRPVLHPGRERRG